MICKQWTFTKRNLVELLRLLIEENAFWGQLDQRKNQEPHGRERSVAMEILESTRNRKSWLMAKHEIPKMIIKNQGGGTCEYDKGNRKKRTDQRKDKENPKRSHGLILRGELKKDSKKERRKGNRTETIWEAFDFAMPRKVPSVSERS